MNVFRRLWRFTRPHSGILALAFLATVVASILDGLTFTLLVPFLRLLFGGGPGVVADPSLAERILNGLIGIVFTADRNVALRNIVLLMVGVVVLKNVFVYVAGSKAAYLREVVARDLRSALYRHIQLLGLAFHQRMKGGQFVSRMIADIDQARLVVSESLISAVQNLILVIVYVTILFVLAWPLALITLLLAPAIALMMRPILRGIRRKVRDAVHERGEMAAITVETLEGARLVKAHGAESYESRRFDASTRRYLDRIVGARRLAVLSHPVSETLGAMLILLVLVLGVSRATDVRPELLVAFLAVTIRLLPPVKTLSQFPANAELALVAASRVFEILDLPPDDVDAPDAPMFPGLKRSIEFTDVWFAYEGETWVLQGVSLTVRVGEVVAVVGSSGAGKSTLVDCLPRFIEPQRGAVLVDGVPLAKYSRRSVRRSMGIVSQHTVIFNDSVRANIAYGDEQGATQTAIETASRAANAHEFIERLPDGYDTLLGERGMTLSGGERQRIAIARALLRDPPILILDEATSALDPHSERLVSEAIARLLENRTVVVIAHRLSTVARADQIVVLDRGRVVERGRHDELVGAGGVYQRLHALELAAMGPR